MPVKTSAGKTGQNASLPYVLPFAIFLGFLALKHFASLPPAVDLALRIVVLTLVLVTLSRSVISLRTVVPAPSLLLGIVVFIIWVGPDLLFPHYREHWLFSNSVLGKLDPSAPAGLSGSPFALVCRTIQAVVLVPILEELFWRAWLMRWLINPRFQAVALGVYAAGSFWITAVLFASEHGPYWDVGLIAGVLYNWWMVRTRSLGDCILAHAMTNACLCAYVIATGHWQYWS